MGRCKSQPFFCVASETAWDVIEALLQEVIIPEHPLENRILGKVKDSTSHKLTAKSSFINLLEVFVDNVMGMKKKVHRTTSTTFSVQQLLG